MATGRLANWNSSFFENDFMRNIDNLSQIVFCPTNCMMMFHPNPNDSILEPAWTARIDIESFTHECIRNNIWWHLQFCSRNFLNPVLIHLLDVILFPHGNDIRIGGNFQQRGEWLYRTTIVVMK